VVTTFRILAFPELFKISTICPWKNKIINWFSFASCDESDEMLVLESLDPFQIPLLCIKALFRSDFFDSKISLRTCLGETLTSINI
jgi:hypothetical protein